MNLTALSIALDALANISNARADKTIAALNQNVALYELVGRMRDMAATALREIAEVSP